MSEQHQTGRVFKTKWFSKEAMRASIIDAELCKAVQEVMRGQADDLGGGVFKKRLNRNQHRSIVLAKGGRHCFYVYLFSKNNRANIDDDELKEFKKLADSYAATTEDYLNAAV